MNPVFRLAKPADAAKMAEIHSLSWEAAYENIIPIEYIKKRNAARPAHLNRMITDDNDSWYIIIADGNIIGIMCIAPPQAEEMEIQNDNRIDDSFYELPHIYLHLASYRRGIGTRAMAFALEKIRLAEKRNMFVWVLEENVHAIRFYEKCGFAFAGASVRDNLGKEMKLPRMVKRIE